MPDHVRLTDDADCDVAVGLETIIELPNFATAGFRWEAKVDGPNVSLRQMTVSGPDPERPGSSLSLFAITASRAGRHTIAFRLRRPWEDKSQAERRLTLHARQID